VADVNSNININFNTAAALAQLRSLQAGLSKFHQSLAEGNLAAANAQKGLNAQLLQSVGATGKFSASQVKVAGSTLAFTAALEKNKLSLREYFRYTMAAATANTRVLGRAFAQEREIINRARRDRVKALQAQYIQMNKANAGFMDAIRIMPKSLQMASGKFTELGTRIQYAAQRQQFLNQLLKQGSTQLLNFGKNTQWAGRQLMVGLTMPLALFGGMAAKTFRDLEKEIVKFKRVYGDAFTNDAETDIAVDNIRKLANEYTKYGVAVTKTVEMAATAAAAGFTGGALNAQVETATKLAVLGQIEQQQALETTISLQSAFGISSEELAKKIDFLNAVENQTLLSIEDLTIAIPKAAPVVKQLGGSVEDLAFFLTAMKEGGINASEGANALKSGLASLINPSDKASKMLAGLGINIKGIVEGNQGDIKATVIGFADALDTLDPLNRARAIEQMFGKFQFSRLSTLFQNVTKDGTQASRALSLAGSSVEELAILSEREMKKIEDSVGVKFQAAVEQFKQDIMPLGKVFLEALTPVVKFFGNLFEKFNGLSDQTKKVVAVIVGVVAGLGPVVLMTFGLVMNAIANGIKLFSKLRNGIARLNGQTTVMGAGFNYMTQEQIENAASSQQLHQTHTRLIEVFNVEANSVNALASSYNSLSTQMRAMASQNPALFAGGMGGAKRAVSKLPPVRKFRDGILSVPGPKGAGDIQPAMLAPGEAVIPAKTTEKYKGLISAIFKDQVPGFMAGRVPKVVAKVKGAKSEPLVIPHEERQSGAVFVGMPISAAKAAQSREILDRISDRVKSGRFGSLEPTDFGTKLKGFKGFSFPERGIGGVYRKPNGEIVVVKPTIDADTALAEERMTTITREIHEGLITPKQTIRTMMDPTDPTGKRKFVVLESPYDPRIAAMDGQFSKTDMIKQLVASTLRGDKDLQRANVSGRIVADVGNSGVYDRASGFREFAKAMPSMEQQAMINLLGVKGGAKKFFAQQTSSIAASMTPSQYDGAIKAEINQAIPKLERLIRSWDLMPDEQIVYNNMLQRLKDGAKVNWAALQPIHARAGDGIKNLELGDFERFKNVPESRVQIEQLRAALAAQATREFNLLSEEQQKRVLSAIAKQKLNAGTSGADDLLNQSRMLKFVDDEMIYKDGLFHDKKTLDAGRLDAGKTYDQVLEKVLYQMGVRQKDGAFVSDAKINGVSRLRGAMSPVGKQSGSWRSSVPRDSQLYKVLDAEEKAFTEQNKIAGKNDPLKSVRERLAALGYTPKQIDYELRTELSHISKTGEPGRGPGKWLSGSAMFDLRILNNFMNASKRHSRILDWNRKNNFPFIPQGQAGIYSEAVEFMSKGGHPTNAREVMLVRKAAELDLIAHEYQKREQAAGRKPKSFPKLGPAQMSQGVMALIDDRIGTGYYDSTPTTFDLRSGTDRSLSPLEREVLINPDGTETKQTIDPKTNRVIREKRLTRGNTGTPRAGAVPDSGSRKDSRTETLRGNERVVTQRQRRQSRQAPNSRGFRSFRMPGMVNGDPTATLSPVERLKFERFKQTHPDLNESQLQDILRRKLKHERDIAKAKEKEAAAARKAAKRAELLPKQQAEETRRQTAEARKRYLEEQRRMELNRQQALNYDAAVKEGQRRELQAIKAKQKEATRNRRMLRQEKVGRVSGGAAMALGTAGMGLMMAGQQGAGMAVMGASAVAGMAPMLTNPYVAAGVAVTAVAAGLWMLERQSNKTAKAQSQFVDATSATTGKMKAIGEMNSKVGASEIYAEKRSKGAADRYTTGFDRGKQQYGVTFLEGKVGKDIMSGFTKSMASGTDTAAQQMALQLAGYISDGVMSAEQAHSVAAQIGINLNNQSLTAQISGQLLELVGPGGEDLLKNPLEVRIRLVEEQKGVGTVLKNELETSMSDRSFSTDTVLSELSKYLTPGLGGLRMASLIPGVDAGFVEYSAMEMFTETKGEAQASAGAASGVQSLEFSQAQIDSLNAQYDKDKKILETKKAATKDAAKRKEIEGQISELETRRLNGVAQLRQGNSDILTQQVELFQVAQKRGAVENAFFDSLKEQVRLKAEETGQGDFADAFLKSSADLESKVLEVKIDTIVGSGMMPVATATTLLSMFAGDEDGLETFIDVTTQLQDPGQVTQLINSLGGIEGTVGKELLLEIGSRNPEEANRLMSTIALMQKMAGKEINFQAFFKDEGAIARLNTLQGELEAIEEIKGPITRDVIANLEQNKEAGMPDMSGLLDLWDQWEGLDDEVKKTVIQEYITLLRTITPEQVGSYVMGQAQAAGNLGGAAVLDYYTNEDGTYTPEAKVKATADLVMQSKEEMELMKKFGLLGNNSGGGGKKDNPLAFLDSLAMGLKQVRDGAFNALTPLESLLAVFTNKKTQKDAFNLFDGIQNRLLKKGVGEELRGAIESMSAEDFDKIAKLEGKKALFTFAKGKPKSKATITGLTESGKAVDQGYKEKALGSFNFANEETIKNVQDQTKAYNILISSGLTASQALEVVATQGQAAAIASGAISTSDPDWQKYIKNIRTANTDLERQAVLNKILRENEEFEIYKDMPKLASQMKDLGYGTDQIDKVLGDPQLAKILMDDLKDGKLDAADIAENLDNIEAKKLIDIQVQLNKGNLKEGAELGRQIVDEMFAAYEGLIRTGEEANKIIANDRLISGYEADLEPFTKEIQGLTEDVNDLNRQLEMNPLFGDRAIKALEDENSAYSNDLAIISNAAEEVNKRYDEQAEALSKVQEINAEILDQQKRQLDLADAITSGDISAAARAVQEMRAASAEKFASAQSDALQRARENELGSLTARPGGLTQEQITKKQYENSQKIYAMETNPDRVKILKDIQDKQDKIYNIEENDVERIQAKIDARVEDNRELQRSIDKQLAAITVYGKTREAWDTVNAGIDYHAAAMLTLNNPDALAGLVTAAGKVDAVWTKINGQMDAYKKNMPDSVKTSLGLIQTGETQSEDDKARIAKEREDKQEENRKLAVLSLALRKLTVGATLTDEEKSLVAASQPKNKRRVNSGAFQTLASGGLVPGGFESGAFAKGTDTVPAMLTPGEYVLRKSAVDKYGVDNLDAMNVGYYDFGGLVKSIWNNRFVKSSRVGALSGGIYQTMEEIEKSLSLKHGSNQNSSGWAKWSRAFGRVAFNTLQHGLTGLPVGGWGGLLGVGTGLIDGVAGLIREGSDYGLKGGKYANKQGSKAVHRGFDPKKELDNMSIGQSVKDVGKSMGYGALFNVGGTAVGQGLKKFAPGILQSNLMTQVSSKLPKINSFTLPKLIANIKSKTGLQPSAWEKAYATATQQAQKGGFTPIESLLGAKHSTLLAELEALVPHSGTFFAPKSGIEYAFRFRPGPVGGFPTESRLIESIKSYAADPNSYSEKLGPQHLIEVTEIGTGKRVADLTWDSVTGSIGGAFTQKPYQDQGIMKWLNEYASSFSRLKHSSNRTPEGRAYSAAVGGIMPDKPFIDTPLPINLAIIEALKTSGLESIFEGGLRPRVTVPSPAQRAAGNEQWAAEMARAAAAAKAREVAAAAARQQSQDAIDARLSAWRTDPNRTYNSYPHFEDGLAYIDPTDLAELTRLQNKRFPGSPQFKAKGGIIPEKFVSGGYSSGTDTVPAMLTPGEYVLRKDAVKKYGVENLDAMNLGYYHKGGPVGHRHGRNAPAMPQLVPGTGVYNGSMFIPPQYSTTPAATPEESRGFFGGLARFFGKGDRDPSKTGANNNSWLARYARSREGSKKQTEEFFDKSPLTSWLPGDALGLTGFLKTITGQGTTGDKFEGVFFPLNFLGVGKVFGEGSKVAAPAVKETSGFLSKLGPMFSKSIAAPVSRVSNSIFGSIKAAGSKVTKPIKELFLPAANPNYNIKNSFIEGLQTGKSRMGFIQDPKLAAKIEKITKPLIAKIEAAGYVRTHAGGESWMKAGTAKLPYDPRNAITEGHPLWDAVLAISRAELDGQLNLNRSAKNAGYYASVAGALVKKTKDKVIETFPGLANLLAKATAFKLPGQIDQKALQIGKMLESNAADGVGTGINTTFRATLDGVAGFYKTGLDFAEVQREIFGSLFARAADLIAPQNIPVVGAGKTVANGIFSPDVAAQGAITLKSLALQAPGSPGSFDRLADPAIAASTGYRSAIQAAMRFLDDHDGNLTLNPETLQPGLIDFGRVLDWKPFTPTVDSFVSEMLRPFYTYGSSNEAWKNPELTSAFFSGMDKGIKFLQTLKEKDIVEMLKAAGYGGEELAKKTELILESIKTTGPAATQAAADIKVRQQMSLPMPTPWAKNAWPTPPNAAQNWDDAGNWLLGLGKNPPVAGTSPGWTPPALSTPTNPLKPLTLGLFGASAGAAGLLLADPDLSSVKITTQPPKPKPRRGGGGSGSMLALSRGGLVPSYFAAGGYAIGTDTVPAMLTPGEFVMSKYAVDKYGVDNMKSINSGSSVGDSVYNYNLNLNVKSDANPDEIARAVMVQIKSIDAQRIRGARI